MLTTAAGPSGLTVGVDLPGMGSMPGRDEEDKGGSTGTAPGRRGI